MDQSLDSLTVLLVAVAAVGVLGAVTAGLLIARALLDNAVKFSPPDGTVTVRLRGGELTVRDHGQGIPPEDLPHVVDRFWRSPSARGLPGSGLGLAIVARAVREAGGDVRLGSAPGGGTLAWLGGSTGGTAAGEDTAAAREPPHRAAAGSGLVGAAAPRPCAAAAARRIGPAPPDAGLRPVRSGCPAVAGRRHGPRWPRPAGGGGLSPDVPGGRVPPGHGAARFRKPMSVQTGSARPNAPQPATDRRTGTI